MAKGWAFLLPLIVVAGQSEAQQPLSAIDWLRDLPPTVTVPTMPDGVDLPVVTVEPLAPQLEPAGLVSGNVTGLADTLWQGSDPERLARRINDVPVSALPAARRLLFTLLLTEAQRLSSAADPVLEARARRLMAMGAADPAFSLLEGSQPLDDRGLISVWFDAGLLVGDPSGPCRAIAETPHLAPGYAASIYCAARTGRIATATVMFDGARSLGLMSTEEEELLDRLLHPEFFEDADMMPPSDAPTPLTATLRAAIGEPLSTSALPRAFAMIDLRDIAGWKAQLEAAERLGRAGALTGNALLGVYTARMPAASGGVWDRVAALQRFETALFTGSSDAVAKTLPAAWEAMNDAGLSVAFADVFAPDLERMRLPEPGAETALHFLLLSDRYETAAMQMDVTSLAPQTAYLVALAQGDPARVPISDPLHSAITDGFASMPALPDRLNADSLGETILLVLSHLDSGARGNLGDLTDALLGLRALGLEDVARRAALQLLILGVEG